MVKKQDLSQTFAKVESGGENCNRTAQLAGRVGKVSELSVKVKSISLVMC